MADDDVFEPLPALTEPSDALDELRMEDALADRQDLTPTFGAPTPLGRAPAYDFVGRRFVPGQAGGPLMIRGLATLRQWVEKCIRTRRGENPAVDPDFGCDLVAEDLLEEGMPFDPSAVAEYVSALERGLLVHPRITGVEDIQITGDQDDDGAFVSFTVTVDDDANPELNIDRLPIGG